VHCLQPIEELLVALQLSEFLLDIFGIQPRALQLLDERLVLEDLPGRLTEQLDDAILGLLLPLVV